MEARKASLGATKRIVVEPVSVDRGFVESNHNLRINADLGLSKAVFVLVELRGCASHWLSASPIARSRSESPGRLRWMD